MTDTEFHDLRQKLLSRMVSGEITREEYDDIVAEVSRHQSTVAAKKKSRLQQTDTAPAGRDPHDLQETGARQAAPLKPGETLGNYEIKEQLGRGGMGEVWKAWDTVPQRHVAVKVLPAVLVGDDDAMDRVLASFRRVHKLNHQHICPSYHLAQDDRVGYYLVMMYLEGLTLARYRRRYVERHGSFPLHEVTRILRCVAKALDYAHGEKVIHRDVKPENIMISADGQKIHLLDFGLAAEVRNSVARITREQMDNSGTCPYMAPEQWLAMPQDARTDQYALGVVTYELVAGHLPFESHDAAILMRAALEGTPPRLACAPEHVNAAIMQALAKKPDQRFESCRGFLTALEGDGVAESIDVEMGDNPTDASNVEVVDLPTGQHALPADCQTMTPTASDVTISDQRKMGLGDALIRFRGNEIRINAGVTEATVYYNGAKQGTEGYKSKCTRIEFTASEASTQVVYKVFIVGRWQINDWIIVKRNGVIIADDSAGKAAAQGYL